MLKNIVSLGKTLSKEEQLEVAGGSDGCPGVGVSTCNRPDGSKCWDGCWGTCYGGCCYLH